LRRPNFAEITGYISGYSVRESKAKLREENKFSMTLFPHFVSRNAIKSSNDFFAEGDQRIFAAMGLCVFAFVFGHHCFMGNSSARI
jgi:hypothetical protein